MSGIDSLFSNGLVQIIRRRSRYSAMEGHISAAFMHYALCIMQIGHLNDERAPYAAREDNIDSQVHYLSIKGTYLGTGTCM